MLRRKLLEAGADLGIREIGFNALLSLRLERVVRHLERGVPAGVHAAPDRHGPLDRLGQGRLSSAARPRSASVTATAPRTCPRHARGRRQRRRRERLRADLVRTAGASATSPPAAMGTRRQVAGDGVAGAGTRRRGNRAQVHVVGVERPARVIAPSPYDPEGKAMRLRAMSHPRSPRHRRPRAPRPRKRGRRGEPGPCAARLHPRGRLSSAAQPVPGGSGVHRGPGRGDP